MLAKRVPLLWAFAGGCLSSAAFIGVWSGDSETVVAQSAAVERPNAPLVSKVEPARPVERAARAEEVDITQPGAAELGTSIADVLARLEAEYRRDSAAVEPSSTPAVKPSSTPAPGKDSLQPSAETTAQPTATPNPAKPPAEVVPARDTPVALAATELPNSAPRVEPQPANEPRAEVQPLPAPRDDARQHVASVQVNNVHVGNVHQGDVYQLAVVQYYQMLALSSQAALTSPVAPRSSVTGRRARSLSTPLTRPADGFPFKDYPWGSVTPASALVR